VSVAKLTSGQTPRRGGQRIAPGERSEPGVGYLIIREPRQGRKALFYNGFVSPLQGSMFADSFQGFAALTPGYFLIAPSGLGEKASFATETSYRLFNPARLEV
ncbi:MAG: hypothetical protein H6Q04_438, partial [Acidobacteria bacterium]|nr:hypothetical protein [Acidobacteriota bacterium]